MIANHGEEDEIYPLITIKIAEAKKSQEHQIYYKTHAKTPKNDVRFQLIEDTIVLYKYENLSS